MLEFLEKADILDGNHSLVGEGLEKADLLIRKRSDLHAANEDSANGDTFAQQWDDESRPSTQVFRGLQDIPVHFAIYQDVMNMHRLPVENGSASRPTTVDRMSLANRKCRGDNPVARYFPQRIALYAIDLSINRVT